MKGSLYFLIQLINYAQIGDTRVIPVNPHFNCHKDSLFVAKVCIENQKSQFDLLSVVNRTVKNEN